MTLPEILLWQALRQRPGGLKFRRQHPAGDYILDFYCTAARLAVEIDGSTHDHPRSADRDEARTHWLAAQGVVVLRIPAQEVLRDVGSVIGHIVSHAQRLVPLNRPAAGPPPRSGEE